MSDPDMTPGGYDVHALSGAYAVDALDDTERHRFEEHLRQCAECRDEVASLQEAAGLLGTEDIAPPPPALRDSVLAQITAIRPLPPLTGDDQSTGATDVLAERRRRRSVASRMPLLVAAAAVLIAAVGGVLTFGSDDDDKSPKLTAAERVLAAEDAARVEKRFPDGAQATVVVSRSEGRAVIQTDDMAPAPEGKDYQLWLQTPAGEMVPAGVMPDNRDATVLLESDASRAIGVGITVEPDGGSERPSSEPIAYFPLEA